MPFLLGIVGSRTQAKKDHLLSVVTHHAKSDSIQTTTFNNGIVYAGCAKNEPITSDTIIPLAKSGFFVGKLFDKTNFSSASFTSADIHAITHNPKLVLKNWWGRYVGILHNNTTQRSTLLRDPQGLSTLFYYTQADSIIFSTDLALLYDCLEEKPSLDVDYFMEYVVD